MLDEVDMGRVHACAQEKLPHGRDRADAHDPGVDSGYGRADEAAERLGAEPRCPFRARDDERGGPVVQPARVPGGHGAVRTEGRLEGGELLERRVGARVLVARDLPDGDELVVEAAGLYRGGVAALA